MKHLKNENGEVVLYEILENELSNFLKPDVDSQKTDLVIMFLDVETTTLDPKTGEIIQLAILPVLVSKDEKMISCIKNPIVQLNEPQEPITAEIEEITGITNDAVKNKKINWDKISSLLQKADLIIAHNAKFDYLWIKSTFQKNKINLPEIPWACSMSMINWSNFCRASKSLEVLCAWSGFFYESHNAKFDVIALCYLLKKNNKIKELVESGLQNSWRVYVTGVLPNENSFLKSRNYLWDPEAKSWFKNMNFEEEASHEENWISSFKKWSNPKNVNLLKTEISCLQRFD